MLLAVSVLAVWSASNTSRNAEAVETASRLDHLYQRARAAVAAEAEADLAYRLEPSARIRDDYNAAATDLADVLEQLEREGGAEDRRTAARIARMHHEYLRLDARLFGATDRGEALSAADVARVTALFGDVRDAVDEAAARHRADAAKRITELRRTSRVIAGIVLVSSAIGLTLVALFTSIMVSYRRMAKDAADREILRLERVALVDNLTGLGNHRAMHEEIQELVARAAEHDEPFAVLALDLDGLKEVNDNRGHHEGDRLIQRLADGLRAMLPPGGRGYRIGGDEFLATLPGFGAADAFHFSQQLQTHLAPPTSGIRAPAEDERVEPTHVTVGICDIAIGAGDAQLTLHRADIALIQAKRMRQRGMIWSSGLERAARSTDEGELDHRRLLSMALAKAVDAKDSYTRSHCETVSQLCVLIAEQLGMAPDDIEQLRLAGLLHDVGKIGVPDAILQKPGGLTDEEFAEMQGHSTLGHSIVAAAQLTEEALWVRHHHERIDGRGYPDQLAGDAIPLQSRIIFVADAFEAITSDRPYRAGRPAADAIIELRRCAGTQFDPACVEALATALEFAGPDAIAPASASAAPRRLQLVTVDDPAAGEPGAVRMVGDAGSDRPTKGERAA